MQSIGCCCKTFCDRFARVDFLLFTPILLSVAITPVALTQNKSTGRGKQKQQAHILSTFKNGSIRMTYYNLEPRTIIWNFRTVTWKLREIIEQSYNETCTQKIQYTNMLLGCRPCKIIEHRIESQFPSKKLKKLKISN